MKREGTPLIIKNEPKSVKLEHPLPDYGILKGLLQASIESWKLHRDIHKSQFLAFLVMPAADREVTRRALMFHNLNSTLDKLHEISTSIVDAIGATPVPVDNATDIASELFRRLDEAIDGQYANVYVDSILTQRMESLRDIIKVQSCCQPSTHGTTAATTQIIPAYQIILNFTDVECVHMAEADFDNIKKSLFRISNQQMVLDIIHLMDTKPELFNQLELQRTEDSLMTITRPILFQFYDQQIGGLNSQARWLLCAILYMKHVLMGNGGKNAMSLLCWKKLFYNQWTEVDRYMRNLNASKHQGIPDSRY